MDPVHHGEDANLTLSELTSKRLTSVVSLQIKRIALYSLNNFKKALFG